MVRTVARAKSSEQRNLTGPLGACEWSIRPGGVGAGSQMGVAAPPFDASQRALVAEAGGRMALDAAVLSRASIWPAIVPPLTTSNRE